MNETKNTSSLGSLRFLTGPLAGRTYQITKTTINIGRDPASDIAISDPSVSRHHAQLTFVDDTWVIKKIAPQNTLMLNKREVQQSPLLDRDTVALGPGTTFLFEAPARVGLRTELGQNVPQPGNFSSPSTIPAQPPVQVSQLSQPGLQGWPDSNVGRGMYGSVQGSENIASTLSANAAPSVQPGAAQKPPVMPFSGQAGIGLPGSAANRESLISDFQVPSPPVSPNIQSQAPQGRREATQRALDPFVENQVFGGGFQPSGVPSLEVSTNTDHVKQVYPLSSDKQVFDIGRDPSNTIIINRPTVSAFHARIERRGNQLVFIHPHPERGRTVNGINYQGQSIPGNERFEQVLKRGDIFRISDQNGTFVTLAYNDGSGQTQEVLPEIRPIPLNVPVITLGRAPDNTVVLDHPQVSGHHARVEQVRGGYRIVDTNSTNHVYVNAKRVSQHLLVRDDEIRIGPFRLTFTGTELTQQDESNGVRIDALRLKKTGNNQVILLNDISIVIPPRKFVALVGGSGAGKSTLMDALNGLRPAQNGKVFYNGQDYYQHLAAFSSQLGYVPQDDIIHRDLTVERALYYAAKLRLPEDLTEKEIKERINGVLEDVEMKHRRKLLVSKLSGGQRKRVSIALELLANPSVFFLDEPTSGLDPGLDRKMMSLLRRLADKGHTIVLVTHATNNINACDYICFLCQGGRLAYFGPPNEAKAYFGKTDFAEIYSALEPTEENPSIPAEAEARYRQSPDYQRYLVEQIKQGPAGQIDPLAKTAQVKPPKRGNPWKQFFLLSRRYIELILNDRVNLAILLLQAPIIAIVLFFMTSSGTFHDTSIVGCRIPQNDGTVKIGSCQIIQNGLKDPVKALQLRQIFRANDNDQALDNAIVPGSGGDAQKTLFIMAFAAVVFGALNGSREIVKEAAIYRRERAVNLGITPYIFSKFIVLGALSLVQAFILVFFVNLAAPLDGLNGTAIIFKGNILLEVYISLALTAVAGLMTGFLISAIVPNNDRAMSLISLTLVPQIIFAGVIFNLDPSLQIPAAFVPVRWAMAAMGSSVGLHSNKLGVDSFSNVGNLVQTDVSNPNHLEPVSHLLLSWGFLAVLIIAQGVLIAWFLKRKDVRR
jgi:ABC-type multidrug transport system ATPase subunit/pSer/pThr/pTyr-binding forkhead associated (FHA) protein